MDETTSVVVGGLAAVVATGLAKIVDLLREQVLFSSRQSNDRTSQLHRAYSEWFSWMSLKLQNRMAYMQSIKHDGKVFPDKDQLKAELVAIREGVPIDIVLLESNKEAQERLKELEVLSNSIPGTDFTLAFEMISQTERAVRDFQFWVSKRLRPDLRFFKTFRSPQELEGLPSLPDLLTDCTDKRLAAIRALSEDG